MFVLLVIGLFLPLGLPPEPPVKVIEGKEETGPSALTLKEILSEIKDPKVLSEKAREWDKAANEAEIIMEMIPDRKDKRYKDAHGQLRRLPSRSLYE